MENYATLQQFRDPQARVSRSTLAEQSLAEQAANLRVSLPGLSDEDRALLDRRPAVDGIRDAVNAWDRELRQATASADVVVKRVAQSIADMQPIDGSLARSSRPASGPAGMCPSRTPPSCPPPASLHPAARLSRAEQVLDGMQPSRRSRRRSARVRRPRPACPRRGGGMRRPPRRALSRA